MLKPACERPSTSSQQRGAWGRLGLQHIAGDKDEDSSWTPVKLAPRGGHLPWIPSSEKLPGQNCVDVGGAPAWRWEPEPQRERECRSFCLTCTDLPSVVSEEGCREGLIWQEGAKDNRVNQSYRARPFHAQLHASPVSSLRELRVTDEPLENCSPHWREGGRGELGQGAQCNNGRWTSHKKMMASGNSSESTPHFQHRFSSFNMTLQ